MPKYTLTDIQELINNKAWDSLVNSNVGEFFNYGKIEYQSLIFDKDFILQFCYNSKRYLDHRDYSRYINTAFYTDDFFKHLNERIYDLNIKLTKAEWGSVIENIGKMFSIRTIDRASVNFSLQLKNKDSEYTKLLLEDSFYEKYSAKRFASNADNIITPDLIPTGLSQEELLKLYKRIREIHSAIRFKDCTPDIFLVDKSNKLMKIHISNNFGDSFGVKFDDILPNTSVDDYIQTLKEYKEEFGELSDIFNTYFNESKNIEITDEQIEEITDITGLYYLQYIARVLTKDQLFKYGNKISVQTLIKLDKLSLAEVEEIYGYDIDINLIGEGFFTDEEIASHPQCFEPKRLMQYGENPGLYVTKETIKILRKHWGRSPNWKPFLTDFKDIVYEMKFRFLKPKAMRYLVEKTGVSNKQIIQAIKRKWNRDGPEQYQQNIIILKNFIKKHGEK